MKVAFCFTGNLRSYEQLYPYWKQSFFDRYNTDVYFHLWDCVGKLPVNLSPSLTSTQSFIQSYDFSKIPYTEESLKTKFNAEAVVLEPYYPDMQDTIEKLTSICVEYHTGLPDVRAQHPDRRCKTSLHRINQWAMWYKRKKAIELLKSTGKQYDLIYVGRADIIFTYILHYLPKDRLTVPILTINGIEEYHDYFAIGPLDLIEKYVAYIDFFEYYIKYIGSNILMHHVQTHEIPLHKIEDNILMTWWKNDIFAK